jgi:hypothetical protein
MMQHLYALEQNYINFELKDILFLKFVLRDVIAYYYFVVLNLIFIII